MMIWIDNLFYKLFCRIGLHFPIHAEWMYPDDLICEYCQKYLGEGNHPKILRWRMAIDSCWYSYHKTPMALLHHKGPISWYEAEFK